MKGVGAEVVLHGVKACTIVVDAASCTRVPSKIPNKASCERHEKVSCRQTRKSIRGEEGKRGNTFVCIEPRICKTFWRENVPSRPWKNR